MKQVDAVFGVLLLILVVVAFLNHGSLSLGANPQGAIFGFGYGQR